MTAPPPPPEVRQCQDNTHPAYPAVAVNAGTNRWGVMHPANGGYWALDTDVSDWIVLT
jgi:hypothetical protein